MSIEHILAFNLALIVAVASPGPALLVAIQTTLKTGRVGGITVGCGLAFMASMWTMTALLGLNTVFQLFPWVYATAKILGASYLIFIAWGMWRGARDKMDGNGESSRRLLFRGILVNALNPKSVLFAAAVLVVIFPPDLGLVDYSIIVLNHFIVEMIFYILLAFGMSLESIKTGYLKSKVYFDRTASLVLGGLGLRLLFDRG